MTEEHNHIPEAQAVIDAVERLQDVKIHNVNDPRDPVRVIPIASVPADQRAAAQAAAEEYCAALLADGAAVVKPDPQTITTSTARAPEVAAARTLADKLRALWAAQDRTPETDRADRLVAYAHDLETTS